MSELESADIRVKRHPVVTAPATAATFGVVAAGNGLPPAVMTRVVPEPGAAGVPRWRVEVTIDSGRIVPAEPPPLQPVMVDRSALRRVRDDALHPSMPDDGSRFAV